MFFTAVAEAWYLILFYLFSLFSKIFRYFDQYCDSNVYFLPVVVIISKYCKMFVGCAPVCPSFSFQQLLHILDAFLLIFFYLYFQLEQIC
jgi:hypothetical protein